MDIRKALEKEIAVKEEEIQKLRDALAVLGPTMEEKPAPTPIRRYSNRTMQRYQGGAPKAVYDVLLANYGAGATVKPRDIYRLTRKMLKMPQGTASSALSQLYRHGWLEYNKPTKEYKLLKVEV